MHSGIGGWKRPRVRPSVGRVGRSDGLVGVIFRSDQQPLHLPREVRAMSEPAVFQGSSLQMFLLHLVLHVPSFALGLTKYSHLAQYNGPFPQRDSRLRTFEFQRSIV